MNDDRASRRDPEAAASGRARAFAALRALAGTPRCAIYDVPREQAPRPLREGSIYLRGTPAWRRFLAERRRLDTGELSLVLALRPLAERERLLIVDWGTSYANCFLLVEPSDPEFDLTEPARSPPQEPAAVAPVPAFMHDADGGRDESPLARELRAAFGVWTYWTGTRGNWETHRVRLACRAPEDTLMALIRRHLPVRFPQGAFDHALAELYTRERELFSGAVARARIPFRSRLGLPILHDPYAVDRALRRLVNEGRAAVFGGPAGLTLRFGAGRPVPPDLPAETFERLLL
ncbi:MAG TPA: hypothetical protein VFD32_11360 [Dehalococcoidia bacterium]|nr:hypothetical protein [Dehalococcoidia bacterium]